MKTAAIIAEYNPFHNGHLYHVQQTRKQGYSHIIAVMSGNFVQRGTPAVIDRFSRARAAVQCGVDLVIELPLPWSSSAAPDFADGAIQIVKATGIADALSFGCENEDPTIMEQAIASLQSDTLQKNIRSRLQQGDSYPSAVTNALQMSGNALVADFLSGPNNMLAFEYCKKLTDTDIVPVYIRRIGCGHDSNDVNDQFASASQIRNDVYGVYNGNLELYNLYKTPRSVLEIIKELIDMKAAPLDPEKFSIAAMSRLQCLSAEDFALLDHVENGLEYRLFNAVQNADSLEKAYDIAKNKQVTHARIRRSLLHAALGLYKYTPMKTVPYLRILALNQRGRELLKAMQKSSTLPVLMRHADSEKLNEYALHVYNFNQMANDLYNLCLPRSQCSGFDKTKNVYLENIKESLQ